MITKKILTLLVLLCTIPAFSSHAYWVWSPESGKFINPEGDAQDVSQEQYDYAMGFYKEKDLDEATKQLEILMQKYPDSPIASEAVYRLGTIYEEKADYLKAFETYKRLVESYPNSERFKEVIEREFRIGNLFLSGKKAKFMGLEILPSLPKAAEVFNHITKNAPYSDYGDQAQFYLGIAYKRQGRFTQAVESFQGLIDQYPQSELVDKARFEIAEVSYKRSAAHFRDQRALDDAATQVDRYLERYSDETAKSPEETERAQKLRQIIDEKNAEKNYRVGLYYEKQKYIQSAVIYYEDTKNRYPHTKWGEKASSRLAALQSPAAYHAKKTEQVAQQLENLESQLKTAESKEVREELEHKIDIIKKRAKNLDKEKKETFKNREDDVKRRENELKEKFEKLEAKLEANKDNPSSDFQKAMERWRASLVSEQEALQKEKAQMSGWKSDLGLDKKGFSLDPLPFFGGEEENELEQVRRIEAKKFYKIAEEKRELLEEKESLYKQFDEVSSLIENEEVTEQVNLFSGNEALQNERTKVERLSNQVTQTQKELAEKRKALDSQGQSALAKTAAFLNPFDGGVSDENSLNKLSEQRMHMKEKISSQQNVVDTLAQAFDAELALKEQRQIYENLQDQGDADPQELRKSIKVLEKDIRARYEEIQDRHEAKKKKVAQLEVLSKEGLESQGVLEKAGRVVTAPVVGTGKLMKAFLFGMPSERERMDEKVEQSGSTAATNLREEIELDSLVIEANSREILNLEKQLEILKAKASLAGGLKFRSSFVEVPYAFLEEAITSAKSMIPRRERDEVLIQKLEEETSKLESYRSELQDIEATLKKQAAESDAGQKDTSELESLTQELKDAALGGVDPELLVTEIEALQSKLLSQERAYEAQKETLKEAIEVAKKEEKLDERENKERKERLERIKKSRESLRKNLKKIKVQISELIEKEGALEKEETEILEKRINQIDRVMAGVKSRALSQDLLTERGRIEKRLSQLSLRQNFLSNEMERFRVGDSAGSSVAR